MDSRTILDEGGAENLIGYGDMLFHPMGSSKHIRVQGCFVEDGEVERVIRFVKQNGLAEYDDTIADEIERNSLDNSGEGAAEFEGKDEFFEKAVEVVTEAGQASTSMLQRRLGVGYARAGRIIDQLEEHGIIGPHEGSKPRAVLITRTQWMEMTMNRTHSGKNDPLVRSHSEFAAQTLDAGHEEITARQSEFFNADSDDDFDEEDLMEDRSELPDADTSDSDDEEEFSASIEEYDEDEEETPVLSSSDNNSDHENSGDVIDVDFESEIQDTSSEDSPEQPVEEDEIPLFIMDRKKTTHPKPSEKGTAGGKKTINLQKPASGGVSANNKKPVKASAPPRDFSIFFDDEAEKIDDFFDFTTDKKTKAPKTAPKTKPEITKPVDIPPWEELPHSDNSEKTAEQVDDADVFSGRGDIPPWEEPSIPSLSEILPQYNGDTSSSHEPDQHSVPEAINDQNKNDVESDYDDDDFLDDVMSSPWIKKL